MKKPSNLKEYVKIGIGASLIPIYFMRLTNLTSFTNVLKDNLYSRLEQINPETIKQTHDLVMKCRDAVYPPGGDALFLLASIAGAGSLASGIYNLAKNHYIEKEMVIQQLREEGIEGK